MGCYPIVEIKMVLIQPVMINLELAHLRYKPDFSNSINNALRQLKICRMSYRSFLQRAHTLFGKCRFLCLRMCNAGHDLKFQLAETIIY
jgi:hypothetical protein